MLGCCSMKRRISSAPTLWTAFLPAPITELSIDWTSAMGEPLVFDLDAIAVVFLQIRCCPSASAPASLRAQSRAVSVPSGAAARRSSYDSMPRRLARTTSKTSRASLSLVDKVSTSVLSPERISRSSRNSRTRPSRYTPRYGAVSTMRRPSSLAGCVAIGYRAANAVAPVSTGYPFCTMVSTRPPARGAASKTSTSQPVCCRRYAAVRPAIPAPATTARRDFTIDGRDTLWLLRVSCWRLF